MNIDFTEDEYKTLTTMLYIADWIMSSYLENAEDSKRHKKYCRLYQKIVAFANSMGQGDSYLYDKKTQTYAETSQRDAEVMPFIDSYDTCTVYDTLTHQLAKRDALSELGWEKSASYDTKDEKKFKKWFAVYGKHEEKYNKEFADHGLCRLSIIAKEKTQSHYVH